MHVILWIISGVLAVVFVSSGAAKSVMSKEQLYETGQTGVIWYPMPFIRFVAACELLGAAGLVAPWALGVAPVLTPIAASGLAVLMIGAAFSHARLARERPSRRRKELTNIATNTGLFALLVWIATARFSAL